MEPFKGLEHYLKHRNETWTSSEAIMRWSNVVEALVFLIGFLFVCLVIMIRRQPQPVPLRVRSAASTSRRSGIAG